MRGFFGKNYRKNLAPKITRLINARYLTDIFNTGMLCAQLICATTSFTILINQNSTPPPAASQTAT